MRRQVHIGMRAPGTRRETEMSKDVTRTGVWWFVFLPLALWLLFTLGCGTSSAPSVAVQEVVVSAPLTSVGSQVGDRITPFTLRMVDGSTLTSGDLLSRNRPTFLFFFKKG